jgi:hypothetical protein
MKQATILLCIILLMISIYGCKTKQPAETEEPTATSYLLTPSISVLTPPGIFIDAISTLELPKESHISRARFVHVDFSIILEENGNAREVQEITLNLFPDVIYTGVVTHIEPMGMDTSWVGYLKDVEYSQLTMVYVGGVFRGKFASPQGIYEVTFVAEDLYQIIQVDQQKFQGGEG